MFDFLSMSARRSAHRPGPCPRKGTRSERGRRDAAENDDVELLLLTKQRCVCFCFCLVDEGGLHQVTQEPAPTRCGTARERTRRPSPPLLCGSPFRVTMRPKSCWAAAVWGWGVGARVLSAARRALPRPRARDGVERGETVEARSPYGGIVRVGYEKGCRRENTLNRSQTTLTFTAQ